MSKDTVADRLRRDQSTVPVRIQQPTLSVGDGFRFGFGFFLFQCLAAVILAVIGFVVAALIGVDLSR